VVCAAADSVSGPGLHNPRVSSGVVQIGVFNLLLIHLQWHRFGVGSFRGKTAAHVGTLWPDPASSRLLRPAWNFGEWPTATTYMLYPHDRQQSSAKTCESGQEPRNPSRPLLTSILLSLGATGSNRDETHYRSRYRTAEIHSPAP